MIYELSLSGNCIRVFPTESEALHHAAYMPKGDYTVREWTIDGDFMVCDTDKNEE